MRLRCLDTVELWQELESQWNPLLRRSEADSIFLTWEWLQAWWSTYGASRRLHVLAAYDGEEVVGIAPLYVETEKRWGATWKCLRLIGYGSSDSDYLTFIIKPGREPEFVGMVLERLIRERSLWDLIELDGPLRNSRVVNSVRDLASGIGWELSEHTIPCTTLPLPQRWDDYLQVLKPRQRTKVRSVLAFFETQDAEISACSSTGQIGPWLETMFDLHTRRWQSKGEGGVFGNAAKRQFYLRMSQSALEHGWLSLHRLNWCERPLALQFGFTYGNRFYLLQEGYDPDFEDVRPGMALRGSLIREWIGNGLAEYDFLAGRSRYKLDWGGQLKESVCLRLAAKPGSRLAYIDVPKAIDEGKEKVRAVLPEAVLAWRKSRVERKREQAIAGGDSKLRRSVKTRSAGALYSVEPVRRTVGRMADRFCLSMTGRNWSWERRHGATCMILQFHRVNDDNDPFMPATPVSIFRQQMQYLSQNFRIVSMDDIATGAAYDGGSDFSVAITLDDGYRDNFLHAFPILKELKIPATVYLTTGYVENGQLPWYDQLRLAFRLTTREEVSFESLGGPAGRSDSRAARISMSARVLAWLRSMDEARRSESISAVLAELRIPRSVNLPKPMLGWDDIREMSKHRITFGGHTVWHPALATISDERMRKEIADCKRTIESRLQRPVVHFAYPFGKSEDNGPRAKSVLSDCGFQTAVTTEWGVNGADQDQYELRRYVPSEDSDVALFAIKLDWNRLQFRPNPRSADCANEDVEAKAELVGASVALKKSEVD